MMYSRLFGDKLWIEWLDEKGVAHRTPEELVAVRQKRYTHPRKKGKTESASTPSTSTSTTQSILSPISSFTSTSTSTSTSTTADVSTPTPEPAPYPAPSQPQSPSLPASTFEPPPLQVPKANMLTEIVPPHVKGILF